MERLLNINQPSNVIPIAGFVVKTKSLNGEITAGTKVFINICHSSVLDKDNNLPILISDPISDTDKAGNDAKVVDCCISSNTYCKMLENLAMREEIIQACIDGSSRKTRSQLAKVYTLPKLKQKGELRGVGEEMADEPLLTAISTRRIG